MVDLFWQFYTLSEPSRSSTFTLDSFGRLEYASSVSASGPADPGSHTMSTLSVTTHKLTPPSDSPTPMEPPKSPFANPDQEKASETSDSSHPPSSLCWMCQRKIVNPKPLAALCDGCVETDRVKPVIPPKAELKKIPGCLTKNSIMRPHGARGRFVKHTEENIEAWVTTHMSI